MAACGIAAEDDDGNAASRKAPTMDVSTYVSNINDCENLEDLKAKFAIAIALRYGFTSQGESHRR